MSVKEEILRHFPTPVRLLIPSVIFLVLFFILPMQSVILLGLLDSTQYELSIDITFDNYIQVMSEWVYLKPLLRSLVMATLVSLTCLLLGWPMAYWIAKRKYKLLLIILTAAPFVTGVMLRVTALQLIFQPAGVLEQALARVGIASQTGLMYSNFGTYLGLVYLWLPFMILAIYISLQNFDYRLEEVSATMGVSFWRRFFYIVLPENRVGTYVGLAFVFVPSLGAATESRFLGGPDGALYGNLMEMQMDAGTWSKGAAMAFVLLALSSFLLWGLLFRVYDDLEKVVDFEQDDKSRSMREDLS